MKKWYDEEYEFEIEVTGFLNDGEKTGNDNFYKGEFYKED